MSVRLEEGRYTGLGRGLGIPGGRRLPARLRVRVRVLGLRELGLRELGLRELGRNLRVLRRILRRVP